MHLFRQLRKVVAYHFSNQKKAKLNNELLPTIWLENCAKKIPKIGNLHMQINLLSCKNQLAYKQALNFKLSQQKMGEYIQND